jgi:demethylmenaquinone methyltransferase/2-methoxy-6-polyprenyl-1,4-benzoquinol methylase
MPADRSAALEKYRRHAAAYDEASGRLERTRRLAVDMLHLKPGEVVFDVGCGTGLSFPLLEQCVGPEGRIVGIEQSPEMLERARKRVEQGGWSNVSLVESSAEGAQLSAEADAALFCFVHDILQTRAALENVVSHLRPGARVVAAGTKRPSRWLLPLVVYVWWIARAAMTTTDGLAQPWLHLGRLVPDLEVRQLSLGQRYVARGTVPERRPGAR